MSWYFYLDWDLRIQPVFMICVGFDCTVRVCIFGCMFLRRRGLDLDLDFGFGLDNETNDA